MARQLTTHRDVAAALEAVAARQAAIRSLHLDAASAAHAANTEAPASATAGPAAPRV